MSHLIRPASLAGLMSTAVIFDTDMFFLTVGRPAFQMGFAICCNGGHGICPALRGHADA